MTDKFLKAKHWQLFLLLFGIPLIFQFVIMGTMFSNTESSNNLDPSSSLNFMDLFTIMMILFIGVFFWWFWSVAIGLQSKVPKNIKMKVKKFKFFFFTPLIYMLFFLGLLMPESIVFFDQSIFAIIGPLHIFSTFCMLYILYFAAKTFKTVELQRETSFSDFAGEFFLIWFYPIGIWIIQPKINKMIE